MRNDARRMGALLKSAPSPELPTMVSAAGGSTCYEKVHSTPFQGVLPPSGQQIIAEGWQGVLRHAVLEAMPVGELAENFSRQLGAPTKGAEVATHFLAPGKRGWPHSTPYPLFSRHSPLSPIVDRQDWAWFKRR